MTNEKEREMREVLAWVLGFMLFGMALRAAIVLVTFPIEVVR